MEMDRPRSLEVQAMAQIRREIVADPFPFTIRVERKHQPAMQRTLNVGVRIERGINPPLPLRQEKDFAGLERKARSANRAARADPAAKRAGIELRAGGQCQTVPGRVFLRGGALDEEN